MREPGSFDFVFPDQIALRVKGLKSFAGADQQRDIIDHVRDIHEKNRSPPVIVQLLPFRNTPLPCMAPLPEITPPDKGRASFAPVKKYRRE